MDKPATEIHSLSWVKVIHLFLQCEEINSKYDIAASSAQLILFVLYVVVTVVQYLELLRCLITWYI